MEKKPMAELLTRKLDNSESEKSQRSTAERSASINIDINSVEEGEAKSKCHCLLSYREVTPVCPRNLVHSTWTSVSSPSGCKSSDHRTRCRETDSQEVNKKRLRLLQDGVVITAKTTSLPSANHPLSSPEDLMQETMTTRISDVDKSNHPWDPPSGSYKYNINDFPIVDCSSTNCACAEMVGLSSSVEVAGIGNDFDSEEETMSEKLAGTVNKQSKKSTTQPKQCQEKLKENVEENELKISKVLSELHEAFGVSKNGENISSAEKQCFFVQHACQSPYYPICEATSSSDLVADGDNVCYLPRVAYRGEPTDACGRELLVNSNGEWKTNLEESVNSTPKWEIRESSSSQLGLLQGYLPRVRRLPEKPVRRGQETTLKRPRLICSRTKIKIRKKRKRKVMNAYPGVDYDYLMNSWYQSMGFPGWPYPTMVLPVSCWHPSSVCPPPVCAPGCSNICRQLPITQTEHCQQPRGANFSKYGSPAYSPTQLSPYPPTLVKRSPKPPRPPPRLPVQNPPKTDSGYQLSRRNPMPLVFNPYTANLVPNYPCPPLPYPKLCESPFVNNCPPQSESEPSLTQAPSVTFHPSTQMSKDPSSHSSVKDLTSTFAQTDPLKQPMPKPTRPQPPLPPCPPMCCVCSRGGQTKAAPSSPVIKRDTKPKNMALNNRAQDRSPAKKRKKRDCSHKPSNPPGILREFVRRCYSPWDLNCCDCFEKSCAFPWDMSGECCCPLRNLCHQ